MGVRLTEDEIDEYLASGHTLIIATTRKSGEPFMTPIWYVWMDGSFWVRTGPKSAKVQHIRRDPRVCCMVEEGEAWIDLKAVIANCDATFVEDPELTARVGEALDAKYAAFKLNRSTLPDATRNHYAGERTFIRMTPRPDEIRSWWNRKIRVKAAE
jgi:PPOX class probable F420-dependent enzyme